MKVKGKVERRKWAVGSKSEQEALVLIVNETLNYRLRGVQAMGISPELTPLEGTECVVLGRELPGRVLQVIAVNEDIARHHC